MRFARTETQRAEDTRHIRRVILFQALLRHRAMIHQPLQAEHTDHIRLGFLESGISRTDRLADIHLLTVPRAKSGPSSCEISCISVDARYPSAGRLRRLARLHQLTRDRQDHVMSRARP